MGYIYILTNPSFPDYVKLGYADDVKKRLVELNRSECIPFAFRIYATYEVSKRLTDISLHNLIDKLNPTLRAIDTFNGKPRRKEFYAMTKEDAFLLLKSIAEIHDDVEKLKLYPISENDKIAEEMAQIIEIEISGDSAKTKTEPIVPIDNILPDGVYKFSQKSKNTKLISEGILEVKKGHMYLKAGSVVATESERRDDCKCLYYGLKIENNILKEDVIMKSVSTAARIISGRSSNGWVSWKDADGNYIDIYRKKEND